MLCSSAPLPLRPASAVPRCRRAPLQPRPISAEPSCGRAMLLPRTSAVGKVVLPHAREASRKPAGGAGATAAACSGFGVSELSDASPEHMRYRTGDRLDVPARYIEIGPRYTKKRRFLVYRAVVSMYLDRYIKSKFLDVPYWNSEKPVPVHRDTRLDVPEFNWNTSLIQQLMHFSYGNCTSTKAAYQ